MVYKTDFLLYSQIFHLELFDLSGQLDVMHRHSVVF